MRLILPLFHHTFMLGFGKKLEYRVVRFGLEITNFDSVHVKTIGLELELYYVFITNIFFNNFETFRPTLINFGNRMTLFKPPPKTPLIFETNQKHDSISTKKRSRRKCQTPT